MNIELKPFDKSCPSLVEGQFEETPDCLIFKWTLPSDSKILIPPPSEQNRIVGLWESTCFEVFLKNIETSHYLEFNFSPSTDWNAFSFETYRGELKELELPTPSMTFDGRTFEVIFIKNHLPTEFNKPGLRSHWMTTVLKFEDGRLQYLAPKHPEKAPDFHQFFDEFTF